jgi:hypothetical protein
MMNLRKKTLALAMATAVLGGGASAVQAQFLNPDGLGQALIYPYYTTNAGWSTFIHVINTSAFTVAAKVRFLSAPNSTDIYDIVLVLSPYDMWTAVVERQGTTNGVRATDNSCTAPFYGKDVFQPFSTQTNSSEGYAEIIMMGYSTLNPLTNPGSIAALAKHDPTTGVPLNCNAVDQAFASPGDAFRPIAAQFDFPPGLNPLTGKFNLVNVGKAWAGASRAVTIANFTPVGSPYTPNNPTGMWSQAIGDFEHPTLAEGAGGLGAVNAVLNRTSVINEWNLNPGLGERASWVLTFPTKALTVNAINALNAEAAQAPKLANNFNGCQRPSSLALYNREELVRSIPSGSQFDLCNEVNVVNFRNASTDSSTVLASNVGVTIDTSSISTGVAAGWAEMGMPANSIFTNPLLPQTSLPGFPLGPTTGGVVFPALPYAAAAGPVGRPVVGFNITARDAPADTVVYDHAYRR